MDWFVHRLIKEEYYTYQEMSTCVDLDAMVEAHSVLDAFLVNDLIKSRELKSKSKR